MSARAVAVCAVAICAVAATTGCSQGEPPSSASPTASVASSPATSDSAVPTSVDTSGPVPTSPPSTAPVETSSTIPAVEGLGLSARGLGTALFGAEAESVVEYVTAILGPPTTDSGWVDPFMIGAACPGSEIRFVYWDDLHLFFSDETSAASGLRHFASFTYGPAAGPTASPYGLTTSQGIGLGSTVSELRAAHPGGLLSPGDEVFAPKYQIEEGFVAYLTETVGAGIVRSFEGGFGCSE